MKLPHLSWHEEDAVPCMTHDRFVVFSSLLTELRTFYSTLVNLNCNNRTMVWKTRDSSHHGGSAEFSVEVIKTAAFADLKIHSSLSCCEVVYAPPEERRVRFFQQVHFVTIRNREDISPAERETLWFRKTELKRMRRRDEEGEHDELYEQIVKQGPPQNDDWQEALLQLGAVSAVLDEQSRQRERQICDPELISRKYRSFVQRSGRSMFMANLAREEERRKQPLKMITDSPLLETVDSL
jgi:hypothetical protein